MKRVRFGILRRVLSNGPRSLSSDLAVFSVAVVVALKVFGGGGGREASVSRLGVREDVISLLRGSCARFFASFWKSDEVKENISFVFEYSSRKEVSLRIYQKRALNAIQRILRICAL